MYYDIEVLRDVRKIHIADILKVQRGRGRVSIRCPFHSEKTGSFVIYPDGGYHCFGCGKNGSNAIDFVMELGCSFNEAVEELQKFL